MIRMTKLVKCPVCGQPKRIDHSRTRSFNCCGIRLPIEGHIVHEGVKRPTHGIREGGIIIAEEDEDKIGLSSLSREELRGIIKTAIREYYRDQEDARFGIVQNSWT